MNPSQPTDRAAAQPSRESPPPRVWVISGYRAGERTQLMALAEALGWPFEAKSLSHRPWDFAPGLLRLRSLAGIDRSASSPLAPPWPDLVLSAGMRNEPVARWIRRRAGGRCRLVSVGRPWAGYDHFDLVVTTPQYRLPQRPNILQNTGTMHRISAAAMTGDAARWRETFSHLPSPRIGVLVGGDSGPYTLGRNTAARLARAAVREARDAGGSLLVTTSSRTSGAAADALAAGLDGPHFLHRWTASEQPNPYLAILATAQSFIVTSDSVSMLSEAVGTGRPVYIFDLDPRRTHGRDGGPADPAATGDFRLGAYLYRLLMRYGHRRLTRDLDLFHRQLIDAGHAAWLGEATPPSEAGPLGDTARAVARVRGLMGFETGSSSPAP